MSGGLLPVGDPETSERGGGKKHEILAALHSSHFFNDYFLQAGGGGGHGPFGLPPESATDCYINSCHH